MFFGLLELARNPEAQEKAYEEAKRVLGDRNATYEDYSSLPYNKGVYKEGLRLHPPTFIPRTVYEDTELGGYKIPAGVRIVTSSFVTIRSLNCTSVPNSSRDILSTGKTLLHSNQIDG